MWKLRVTDHFLEGSWRVECGSDSLWGNSTLPWVSGQGCLQWEQVCVWWAGRPSYLPGMVICTLEHAHPAARWGEEVSSVANDRSWRLKFSFVSSVLEFFLTSPCFCCLAQTIHSPLKSPCSQCCCCGSALLLCSEAQWQRGDAGAAVGWDTEHFVCLLLLFAITFWWMANYLSFCSFVLFLWWKCSFDR